VFAFGVSAPLVTALGAGLLVGLDWVQRPSQYTQHDVVELLGGLLLLYGVVLLPLFVGTLCHVLGWRGGALAPPKTRWQFSLRTLLVLMTVVAIGVALLGGAARVVNDKIALWVFGGYAVVVFAACGVTIERFQAARQEE
jgi:hypothetical protein